MKRTLVVFLLIAILLTGCTQSSVHLEGIAQFSRETSSVSLCENLIPENFTNTFVYVDGNYFYDCRWQGISGFYECERVLMYLQYEEEIYLQAKAYAMGNLNLSKEEVATYGDYYFFDNYELYNHDFPKKFVRFAYNDISRTLVFLGFSVSIELYEEAESAATQWGGFLEKYYGDFYTF